jgi:hypothetical protein
LFPHEGNNFKTGWFSVPPAMAVTDAIKPELIYKDHRITVRSVGRGWRAMIYAPGSNAALRESPASLEECRKEAIVAEAKWIADARCAASSR